MFWCNRNCWLWMLSFGIIFMVLGLLIALSWDAIYNRILTEEFILTNTSKSYNLWKGSPIPIYLSVYLFNWTNADEVLRTKWTVKPKFQECGPYVFSENRDVVNVTWNGNGTVTYQRKLSWYFRPELSKGRLGDNITNINQVAAVAGYKVRKTNFLVRRLVNFVLKRFEHSLVITKTAEELLITGYEDKLLDLVSTLKIPNLSIANRIGWFYSRNNSASSEGWITIYTGRSNTEGLGMMDLWNGRPRIDDYGGHCGLVNGSSGGLWPPAKNYEKTSMFLPDICSSLTIEYGGDEAVHGMAAKKFVGTDYAFDNGTKYPEQVCFRGDVIVPSGARSISKCMYGAPLFVSYPHFYLADPSYFETIQGMVPNRTLHGLYVSLEPNTGILMDLRIRLQMNIFVEPVSSMSMFKDVKPTYMPIGWFSQKCVLTEEYSSMVRMLIKLYLVGVLLGWTLFCVGILVTIVGLVMVFRKRRKQQESEVLIETQES